MKKSVTNCKSSDSSRTKWQRIYKACISCRNKKMKCDMGPLDSPHGPPCMRCRRENKECILPKNKKRRNTDRGSELNKMGIDSIAGMINSEPRFDPEISRRNLRPNNKTCSNLDLVDPKWKSEMGTLYNALVFLAKAPGSISKEENMEMKFPKCRSDLDMRNISNTTLNGVTGDSVGAFVVSDESILAKPNESQRVAVPLIDELSRIRPKSSRRLRDIEYIGSSKLLSEDEAIRLIDIFFLTMHPFFPHIPLQLQDAGELSRYPILLCAILTVSSRYNRFSELGFYDGENHDRNIQVHERLWIYCQRLISQTIWAEASTRSIGTVLAFLLFTEWNPRSIHWKWSDYANNPELNDVSKRDIGSGNTPREADSFTGIAAARRSARMAWMLTGTAVRLAQDMSFIDTSPKIFVATHITEAHTAMNLNQKSILSDSLSEIYRGILEQEDHIGNENFYLENILQNDESIERWSKFLRNMSEDRRAKGAGTLTDMEREYLNDEYVLYYVDTRNDISPKSSLTLPFPLKFSYPQRAKIELLKILTIGYESVYQERESSKFRNLDGASKRNLILLEILSRLIIKWHGTYKDLLLPTNTKPCSLDITSDKKAIYDLTQQIDRENISFDYNYCRLYIYSFALQTDVKNIDLNLKMTEIKQRAKYVELAYTAAKEILDSTDRLHSLRMLRYMPVRWVTLIVRAVAFLVKCYLVLTKEGMAANPVASAILRLAVLPSDQTLPIIERAAVVLREAAPDELHLGMRYSKILTTLCAEIKMHTQVDEHDEKTDQGQQSESYCRQCQQQPSLGHLEKLPSQNNPLSTPTDPSIGQTPGPDIYNQSGPTMNLQFEDSFDLFATSGDIGLDFVDTWTEMIENRYVQEND